MPELGELITETLAVDPYDLSTAVTLVVTDPNGSTVSVAPPAPADSGHTWSTVVTYSQIGVWHLAWTITGTGAGVRTLSTVVDAPYALAAWAPERVTVADYVPGRTLARPSSTAKLTFDDTTVPTGDMVDRLIGAAVAWVLAPIGEIHASLYKMASATAAVRAAGFVELGYPTRPDDITTANTLLALATQMRTDLKSANEALTGGDPNDPAGVLPQFSFPAAPPWGDTLFY